MQELHDAARRVLAREGVIGFTLARVADEAGVSLSDVRAYADTEPDLLREVLYECVTMPVEAVHRAVEGATDGAEVLDAFLSAFFQSYEADIDAFRLALLAPQVLGAARCGLSKELVTERIVPLNDRLFGPAEAKLAAVWGTDELPHGIHPRRLVFVAYLAAIGLLTLNGVSRSIGDTLLHSNRALLTEMSRALSSPTTALVQLALLNDAAAELSRLRDEESLRGRVPGLACSALGLDAAWMSLCDADGELRLAAATGAPPPEGWVEQARQSVDKDATVFFGGDLEGPLWVVCPLRVQGAPVGTLMGEVTAGRRGFDRRDATRWEMFAKLAGQALDSARFYDTLQARLAARERELKSAEAALVQSEKMAALGQLVASMAHELNTPLGAVRSGQDTIARAARSLEAALTPSAGAAEAPRDDRAIPRAVRAIHSSTRVIADATERLQKTVKRLERFAGLDRAEVRATDLEQCVDDALDLLAPGPDVHVEKSYAALEAFAGRPAALSQAFHCLLANAIEAMPEGGRVRVATRCEGAHAVVSISDEGEGIAPAHLDKIFDPGFTTKGVGVGGGLGLSIAYRIIEAHGGTIRVESELGRGTTFEVSLPLSVAGAEPPG
jgi:signal transduction histidine kinase